jgi:hypothetical protein
MSSKNTKIYLDFMNEIRSLSEIILKNRGTDKDRMRFALCLSEIYFSSHKIITLIKKVSEGMPNSNEKELDALLGNLVDLKIYVYDEFGAWMKKLKKPLQQSIDEVEDMLVKCRKKKKRNLKPKTTLKNK